MPWYAYLMVAWFVYGGCASVAQQVKSTDSQAAAVAVGSVLIALLLIWGTIALAGAC